MENLTAEEEKQLDELFYRKYGLYPFSAMSTRKRFILQLNAIKSSIHSMILDDLDFDDLEEFGRDME